MKKVILATAFAFSTMACAAQAANAPAVFNQCRACHSVDKGKNLVGPSLFGVAGRKAASEPGYNYSPAFKEKLANTTWTKETFEKYITDPRAEVPGTKMIFPGLKKPEDRDAVWAYLETLK